MEAIRRHEIVVKDGELRLTGLPCKKGQDIELILLIDSSDTVSQPSGTAKQLLQSGLIGLWKNRDDINDSAFFARQLRDTAQERGGK